jgi:hypothetical protein
MLTIQQKIEEARAAYHQLNTGRMPRVVVDQNGERVEFTAANRTGLYTYIQQLEAQLPSAPVAFRPTNGPAGFLF